MFICSLATTWLANDKLLCRVPAGAGTALPISVEVTGRRAFVNDAFAYEPPLISKVCHCPQCTDSHQREV
jgi:hypothetical protein